MLWLSGCASSLVNSFAFHPERLPPTFPSPSHPRVHEVCFASGDGTQLQAYEIRQPGASRVVLYLHGNAGCALDRVDEALRLSDLGCNVLLLSYRGYGKSAGAPSEAGVYLDAHAALDYIHERLGADPGETFILGRSIGSAVAVEAAQERDLAGLILLSPLSTGRDMARHFGLGWIAWIVGNPFDSVSRIGRVTCPVLFVHGDRDDIVPMEDGKRLYDACPFTDKTFHVVAGAGHNDLLEHARPGYDEWVRGFLSRCSGSRRAGRDR